MDDPLVSVVVPAFNAERTIAATLASVPAGDDPTVELIVVDDASTDGTRAAAEAFARATGRPTTLVALPRNVGPAAARNVGLRRARGAYVGFLDSDDRYAPAFLTDLLSVFRAQPDSGLVSCGIALIDCPRPVHRLQKRAVLRSAPGNLLVRREVAELVGGFPEDEAFRGPVAGEDAIFRGTVRRHFVERHVARDLSLGTVRPGNHLVRFLERSLVRDGKLVIGALSADEESGAIRRAKERYEEAARRRLIAAREIAR